MSKDIDLIEHIKSFCGQRVEGVKYARFSKKSRLPHYVVYSSLIDAHIDGRTGEVWKPEPKQSGEGTKAGGHQHE
jgi:hypothetical protein